MPPVRNFSYQKINSLSDIRDIVGQTHRFRVEPSGTQWWVPDRSYFRARLRMNITMNLARIAGMGYDEKGSPSDGGSPIDSYFPLVVNAQPSTGCTVNGLSNETEVTSDDLKSTFEPEERLKGYDYDVDWAEGISAFTPYIKTNDPTEEPLESDLAGASGTSNADPYCQQPHKVVTSSSRKAAPRVGQLGATHLSGTAQIQMEELRLLTNNGQFDYRSVTKETDYTGASFTGGIFSATKWQRDRNTTRLPLQTQFPIGVSTSKAAVQTDVWSQAMKYRFLEALKFVDLADNCMDAFFDQISFSVGTTKTETIQDPQLTQTMRQRTKCGALANGIRQDLVGVYKDEQRPNIFSGNVGDKSDNSLFSLLGYDNIRIDLQSADQDKLAKDVASRTFNVEFEVLYRPPLAVFRKSHAMPACRYEIEFKGVSNQSQLQNNFFHCTRPGGLGRWAMTHHESLAGDLVKGPACKFDGTMGSVYGTNNLNGHASHQLFFFEPICGSSGIHHHRDVVDAYLFGRQGYLDREDVTQRIDPGVWVSAVLLDMHMEMAVVEGMEAQQANFVLHFDHIQPIFQTLNNSVDQNITFDVDARANTFMFGFRKTTVDDDVCLQAGHLQTLANTERDLLQYHINFDLKTRPQNFATNIDLNTVRGANNEQLRSQVNTMVHFKGYPETVRAWMKKGPYFAYHWPRGINSNATRFLLNLRMRDNARDANTHTYGPYGQFEYEKPITTANFSLPRVHPLMGNGKTPDLTETKAENATAPAITATGQGRYVAQYVSKQYPLDAKGKPDYTSNPSYKKGGFYLKPTVFHDTGSFEIEKIHSQPVSYPPYWSVEVPQSLSLQAVQTRLLSCDYPSAYSGASLALGNLDRHLATYWNAQESWSQVNSLQHRNLIMRQIEHLQANAHLPFRRTQDSQLDMGYRGTEHSAPTNCRLNSTENSVILFQVIPKAYYISIVHGRVTAVETPMNNN
jgi:hypothetical protein